MSGSSKLGNRQLRRCRPLSHHGRGRGPGYGGNALEPLIVFAASPFGVAGSSTSLRIMNAPFGFMAFLGVGSLIAVIVSHVIVLFDHIDEQRLGAGDLRDVRAGSG
jgi:hypothetical protein